VRPETAASRQRLYLLACVVVKRHYRRQLTLAELAAALACSPRQLQRAYDQFSESSFSEDLLARRMAVAAELLLEQRSIPVSTVARLVGYRQAPHFAQAFRRRYGLAPARFREQARAIELASYRQSDLTAGGAPAVTASPPSCSAMSSTRSAPGSSRRMEVPPPSAGSAVTRPPC
jgi:AraC-like DNA-binding protein